MSKRYSGMCIGGPKDGEHAWGETPTLNAHWPLAMPLSPNFDEAITNTIVVDRFTYRHVAFHFRNTNRPNWQGKRGFWTSHDVSQDDQHLYVLDALARAYRERANG